MTIAEGGGKRAVWRKFQEVYIPALKANYMVWPLVQMLNFRVIPIQFQIVSRLGSIRSVQANNFRSHLLVPSVSSGQRISRSRTLPMSLLAIRIHLEAAVATMCIGLAPGSLDRVGTATAELGMA